MTESQFQSKLLKALRSHTALRDAVIFKHSDRINGGVPDFSITIEKRTLWVELKRYPNKCTKLQSYYIDKLQRGALLVTDHGNGNYGIWQPTLEAKVFKFDELVEDIAWRFLYVA
jgi:hypothetical protein